MTAEVLAQSAELVDACGQDPDFLCEQIFELTGSETLAGLTDVAGSVITAIVILAVAWILARLARRAIGHSIDRLVAAHDQRAEEEARAELDATEDKVALADRALERARDLAESTERSRQRTETLGAVLKNLASIIIYTIAFVMALGEFEINLGPLIASAGIAGIALGFGAQSLVKDFLSGIFMLIEDQYGVGDVVDVGEAAGIVERVHLRTTQIRDVNGTLWHVPNGEIRRVANKSQAWARTVLDIEVAYDTELEHAMRVIKEVADGVWHDDLPHATILEEPEIWGVENFTENAVVIRLAMKVEPAEQFVTARVVRGRLKEAFDREGIQIPFPQRTIWINSAGPAPPDSIVPSGAIEEVVEPDQPESETG